MAILKVANIHFDTAGTTLIRVNGANTLTFNTAGAEDMRIDPAGNVLIGRTNSTVGNNVKLDVAGGINASAVLVNGQSIIAIFDGANTITNAAFTQANTARDQGNTAFTQANTARTQANTAFLGANAALIQANTARDQANAAFTQANSAFLRANSTTYTSNIVISVADNTNAALRITQTGTGDALRVEDDTNPDSTPFVVDANGNVGIGTSLPSYKLIVRTPVLGADGIAAAGPAGFTALLPSTAGGNFNPLVSANDQSIIFYGGSSGAGSGTGNLIIAPWSTSSVGMKIDYNGNVLIGRTNSTVGNNVKLDVNGAINASAVLVNGAPLQTTTLTSNVVIAVADNSNAALRITQTGTGNAILVEDETNPDSSPFTVTGTGNVGIGTTTINAKLHVVNGIVGYSPMIISGLGGGGLLPDYQASGINYYDANSHVFRTGGTLSRIMTLSSSSILFDSPSLTLNNSSQYKTIEFDHTDVRKSYITYDNTNSYFNFDAEAAGAVIAFSTQNAEKVRIQSTGNVLIGRTNSTVGQGVLLDVNGGINASAVLVNGAPISGGATIFTDTVNATRYVVFDDATSGTMTQANVSTSLTFNPSTGTLSSTIFNSTSDETLKYDVKPIENALAYLDEFNGVHFKWKKTNEPSLGVIAQDVEKVLPELVDSGIDHKTVNYNGLIAVLIQAVKELKAEIEVLKNR